MIYFSSFCIITLNLISAFGKRYKRVFAFLLLFLIWVLFWGSNKNPDYQAYYKIYYSNAKYLTLNMEFGFILLVKIANSLHLTYGYFLALLSALGFYLIHSTVREYTKNYNLVYMLYFICPFFLDVVQIRNFLVMSIFIYSTKYLVRNSKLKYIACILVAASINIIGFAYLPMVFINGKKKNLLIRAIASISIIGSIIIMFNDRGASFITALDNFSNIEKFSIYMHSNMNYGFLLFWFLQIFSFFMIYISRKIYLSLKNNLTVNKSRDHFISIVYWINIMGFIFFPLYIINSNFTRLLRNTFILNFICFAITYETIQYKSNRIVYSTIIIIYTLFLYTSLLLSVFSSLILPILDNNLIFKLF